MHRITNSGRTARDAARMNGHHSLLRVLRSPVARARWGRAIAYVRVVTAFLAAGRSKLLREADAIFSAACGGTVIKVPEEFVCPITMELFKDPVVAADGFTYERRAIERHLQTVRARSPKTNLRLAQKTLFPNTSLRILIGETVSRGRALRAAGEQPLASEPASKRQKK